MIRFALFASIYYTIVKLLYKACAIYVGWKYPGFMGGWYDFNHKVIRSIPEYGFKIDNIVRDNFSDGDLVFWSIWFGLALLIAFIRLLFRAGDPHPVRI